MADSKEIKDILKLSETAQNPAEFFINSFLRDSEKTALDCEDKAMTYSQLYTLSAGIRQILVNQCRSESICGIFAHKSPMAYAAVLGILSSQKAYVPLNPAFPKYRNQYILNKADVRTLIVGDECLEELKLLLPELQSGTTPLKIVCKRGSETLKLREALPSNAHVVFIPLDPSAHLEAPDFTTKKDDLAYVLFTSGSTGKPKGVMVKCSNVTAYINNMINKYALRPQDRFSATFDLTFDVSVHDMFTCWAIGGTLVPIPNRLLTDPINYTRNKQITVWFSVPSVPLTLETNRLTEKGALPDLRHSFFAGEKFPYASYSTWQKIAPNSAIYNLYGPTEATVTIVNYKITDGLKEENTINGTVPIGYPVNGQKTLILNEGKEQVSPSKPGKMFVSGSQVTAGYLGETELTRKAFVTLPGQEGLWYDTGDIVIVDKDHCHHYIGRADQQIQIMGYRVELGEIEHVLEKVTHSPHCIVGALTNLDLGMDEIYAVLLSNITLSKKEIRTQCRQYLPNYMIPKKIHFVSEYPVNSSGKIDRLKIRRSLMKDTQPTNSA